MIKIFDRDFDVGGEGIEFYDDYDDDNDDDDAAAAAGVDRQLVRMGYRLLVRGCKFL